MKRYLLKNVKSFKFVIFGYMFRYSQKCRFIEIRKVKKFFDAHSGYYFYCTIKEIYFKDL